MSDDKKNTSIENLAPESTVFSLGALYDAGHIDGYVQGWAECREAATKTLDAYIRWYEFEQDIHEVLQGAQVTIRALEPKEG